MTLKLAEEICNFCQIYKQLVHANIALLRRKCIEPADDALVHFSINPI